MATTTIYVQGDRKRRFRFNGRYVCKLSRQCLDHSVQFSPDGKTVATASRDETARLWSCDVCRPVAEIAAELSKAVGRELTEAERRQFGVPEKPSLKDYHIEFSSRCVRRQPP